MNSLQKFFFFYCPHSNTSSVLKSQTQIFSIRRSKAVPLVVYSWTTCENNNEHHKTVLTDLDQLYQHALFSRGVTVGSQLSSVSLSLAESHFVTSLVSAITPQYVVKVHKGMPAVTLCTSTEAQNSFNIKIIRTKNIYTQWHLLHMNKYSGVSSTFLRVYLGQVFWIFAEDLTSIQTCCKVEVILFPILPVHIERLMIYTFYYYRPG